LIARRRTPQLQYLRLETLDIYLTTLEEMNFQPSLNRREEGTGTIDLLFERKLERNLSVQCFHWVLTNQLDVRDTH